MSSSTARPSRFGLVKSLVSVAMLAGMAGVVVPGVDAFVEHSRGNQATQEMLDFSRQFHRHRQDTARWPALAKSSSLVTQRNKLSAYRSLFESPGRATPALDPWGQPYIVCSYAQGFDDTHGGLIMLSAGPDGQVQSDDTQVFNTRPGGDDLTQLITFNLN